MLVDLHHHTTASDGTLTPGQAYAVHALASRGRERRAVVVTDHDTAAGQEALGRLEERYGFGASAPDIWAVEVTSGAYISLPSGSVPVHFNVYCGAQLSASQVPKELCSAVRWAEKNGCLVQLNHPALFLHTRPWRTRELVRRALSCGVHMIEGVNANQGRVLDRIGLWAVLAATGERVSLVKALLLPVGTLVRRAVRALDEAGAGAVLTANTDAHLPGQSLLAANYIPYSVLSWSSLRKSWERRELKPILLGSSSMRDRALHLLRWRNRGLTGALLRLLARPRGGELLWAEAPLIMPKPLLEDH